MTATDPRPELAAMLAARLAPAAEALAASYEQDMSAGPPPQDDRAFADYHRAGRAALVHLRELLAVLDWAAARLPEPEPEGELPDALDDPVARPGRAESDYDGSEDRYHYRGEVYEGSQDTPEFRAWLEEQKRRSGQSGPGEPRHEGGRHQYNFGDRTYVGKLTTPEFEAWLEQQRRREAEERAARLSGDEGGCDTDGPRAGGALCPDGRQRMTSTHGDHDIP